MKRQLNTIAVDLTPVLPGGENGGAKVFVLELLRGLADLAPGTAFVLLTRQESHQELAALDRPNMRRELALVPAADGALQPRLKGLAQRLLPLLPGRVRRLAARAGYALNAALKRRCSPSTLLRDLGADLLFCPFTAPTYAEPGIPAVCTVYDLQHRAYPQFFAPDDVAHREHTFLETCARATIITVISDFSRDAVLAQTRLDPERVRTILLRMARRIAPGSESDDGVLGRLGLTPGRYLLCPANFWKHKNHEMLLTAFGMARRAGLAEDIRLVCTGAPGERRQWLMDAARAMGLGGCVLFPGYLPNAELAALMARCAGLVFPSLYEGFGLPVIEAMAAGVPVACSNTTALREVAADAAILFDPRLPQQLAGVLAALVGDEALRARHVQAGLLRAAEFEDSRRMTREYWQLFQDALALEDRGRS